ncbi:uncharacterized protein LOC126611806 [Malus sylvestris]|uniref:uncharacterized protein LOC126611806 n=1 Tax=Malus sylvestris TaxID=3752 RepID=UPI0021ABFC4B|nr:uncharacterized protein LOC126611806 [Malus sylvestris]
MPLHGKCPTCVSDGAPSGPEGKAQQELLAPEPKGHVTKADVSIAFSTLSNQELIGSDGGLQAGAKMAPPRGFESEVADGSNYRSQGGVSVQLFDSARELIAAYAWSFSKWRRRGWRL